ncbi:hypothetical protein FHS27_003039 [Rhodopirellula rubra]|uniref:Secreted protein n=1 Tax=Aporhodopirellula rubra TaxID=980271 RepID=A0A7W5H6R4_9BACT|nr:DUF6807 family protein [Aporhodopirellula rubra]MBB3207220.1 hypothetical protein [Aporhodopirellula rubra]
MFQSVRVPLVLMTALLVTSGLTSANATDVDQPNVDRVSVVIDDDAGSLTLQVDGKTAFVYRYGPSVDLPHFDPFNSVSGRPMTAKISRDHPHHRSFWVADERVQLEGQPEPVGLYMAVYSGVTDKAKSPWPIAPYKSRVAHVEFENLKVQGDTASFDEKLTWMNGDIPLLDELRHYRVVAFPNGEYFFDFSFELRATYGNVTIKRDTAHYAIPYIRMNDQFNVKKGGGKIVNSEGGINESGTHDQLAYWADYSAPLSGSDDAEGIACMIHPSKNPPHLWLIRDYGTWGPRGATGYHNATFTIAKGEGYDQRVGILVHEGDASTGNVAQRYQQYSKGKL